VLAALVGWLCVHRQVPESEAALVVSFFPHLSLSRSRTH
jgi:hypothetical protein